MTNGAYPGPKRDRAEAVIQRDAAFARIGRVRGATIVGAGALTAAIAAIVSAVAPGRTLGAKTPVRSQAAAAARPARSAGLRMPPLDKPGQLGLQSPQSPPQSAPQTQTQAQTQPAPAPTQTQPAPAPSAPVVSGGS